MAVGESLPLFPLHTVLLPGAALGLRVFERRYLDMVRDCGRNGHGIYGSMLQSFEIEIGRGGLSCINRSRWPRIRHDILSRI